MQVLELPRSISDQVYEYLKDQILTREIQDGTRIVEREVAAGLRISRTPIREAFRRLEQDGLVVRVPQGGVKVTEITPELIKEIFGIRAVLEAYAGELACARMDGETIAKLWRISNEAGRVLDAYDKEPNAHIKALAKLNTRFHDTICKAAESNSLYKLIQNVRMPILRFRALSIRDKDNRIQAWHEHQRMIQLLETGNGNEMSRFARSHVLEAGEAALKTIGKQ